MLPVVYGGLTHRRPAGQPGPGATHSRSAVLAAVSSGLWTSGPVPGGVDTLGHGVVAPLEAPLRAVRRGGSFRGV